MDNIECQVANGYGITVNQPPVGFKYLAIHAVFTTILGKSVDPEPIRLMGALNTQAEFLGKYSGFATMVDMARSPPGSTSAPLLVCVHQNKVQFCCSGVTGMIAAFNGGWAVVTFDIRRIWRLLRRSARGVTWVH
jgi:hypothetical protein